MNGEDNDGDGERKGQRDDKQGHGDGGGEAPEAAAAGGPDGLAVHRAAVERGIVRDAVEAGQGPQAEPAKLFFAHGAVDGIARAVVLLENGCLALGARFDRPVREQRHDPGAPAGVRLLGKYGGRPVGLPWGVKRPDPGPTNLAAQVAKGRVTAGADHARARPGVLCHPAARW